MPHSFALAAIAACSTNRGAAQNAMRLRRLCGDHKINLCCVIQTADRLGNNLEKQTGMHKACATRDSAHSREACTRAANLVNSGKQTSRPNECLSRSIKSGMVNISAARAAAVRA